MMNHKVEKKKAERDQLRQDTFGSVGQILKKLQYLEEEAQARRSLEPDSVGPLQMEMILEGNLTNSKVIADGK
eukprot:CAMPEP_0170513514 /NCGR_PEP_ID=MMETSP0208-20121228/67442_1 /TAXON_ID=197538 /ORGANISM="Strombidium inclinatum, Strain S3" /LENGTH=72 /DNA_ID=CAMNT_0010797251 /DNA_START=98 /DNA_END=316 /DNA_ORIENTATION=-